MRRHAVIAALAGALALAGCERPGGDASSAAEVTAQGQATLRDHDLAAAKRLIAEENALLVDVRTPGEFRARHLPGAVNVPLQQLQRDVSALDALVGGDRSRPLVVYCRSGRRSAIAKKILSDAGFARILDFGAIDDWE